MLQDDDNNLLDVYGLVNHSDVTPVGAPQHRSEYPDKETENRLLDRSPASRQYYTS